MCARVCAEVVAIVALWLWPLAFGQWLARRQHGMHCMFAYHFDWGALQHSVRIAALVIFADMCRMSIDHDSFSDIALLPGSAAGAAALKFGSAGSTRVACPTSVPERLEL